MGDPQRHVGVDPFTAEAHLCHGLPIRRRDGMGYEPVEGLSSFIKRQRSLP